jgi:hemolysin type calcium-binding protein
LGVTSRLTAAAVFLAMLAAVPVASAAERPDPKQAWAMWKAAGRTATASSFIPGAPPELCVGDFWADQIGTDEDDSLEAPNRPERLWGRAGADFLYGSDTRAACLMGGRDPDTLDLWLGGGAAWGEHGSDEISGSPLDDILDGGDGNDVLEGDDGGDAINGGPGVDGIDGGPGDDMIDSDDGRAEVVECGDGIDDVMADYSDILLDCELPWRDRGPYLTKLVPSPQAAQTSSIVRFRMQIPQDARAGAYRVMLLNPCSGGRTTLTRFPNGSNTVKAGQTVRIGLRPPSGGWCAGKVQAAVLLHQPCRATRGCAATPPAEPVARLTFRAR